MIHRLAALLTAFLPDSIIVFMARATGKSKLTPTEKRVEREFIASLGIRSAKSARPGIGKIVAMVGSIGSGKSSVAEAFARDLPAVVVEGDAIRVLLRKAGASYDRVWEIGKNAAIAATENGVNVIIDGDASRAEQRKILTEAARSIHANVIFVRAVCRNFDILLGRIIAGHYTDDSFFGGANTLWRGSAQERGAIVKMRELISLLRRHYRPEKTKYPGRDNWQPKKFSFVDFEIDTTNEKKWPEEVKKIAKQIR